MFLSMAPVLRGGLFLDLGGPRPKDPGFTALFPLQYKYENMGLSFIFRRT